MQLLESMRKPMERHTTPLHRLLGKKAMPMNAIWFCGTIGRQKTVRLVFSIQIHPCTTFKKENIGLIEVMGLAVLPARLAVELDVLKKAMLQHEDLTANPQTASHAVWAAEVQKQHPEFCEENAEAILQAEVGKVFEQVLCDAGVFKRDEAGKTAFLKFLQIFA